MTPDEMKVRTRSFAVGIIKMVERLPRNRTCDVCGKQLVRCGASVGSNYRSACRARSVPDFISKIGIVEEEADESVYWLEMLVDAGYLPPQEADPLVQEANELVAICVTSIKTARGGSR